MSGLPAPQYEYRIAMPDVADEGADADEVTEEDAADIAARKRAEAKAREQAALRKRSQVCSPLPPPFVTTHKQPPTHPRTHACTHALRGINHEEMAHWQDFPLNASRGLRCTDHPKGNGLTARQNCLRPGVLPFARRVGSVSFLRASA